jgi:hypothetical protein
MRFAALTVAFAASITLAAAQSANTDPTMAYFKIDLSRLPSSVNVLNWPDVQAVSGTVSVDNFPAVQTVGGTVNIGNLPAAQNVAGSVSVSNLPITDDGSVRVSSGPSTPARQTVMYELMPYYVAGSNFVSLPEGIDTSGYSAIGVLARGLPGFNISIQVYWQLVPGDVFTEVHGQLPRSLGMSDCSAYDSGRHGPLFVCPNYGGRPGVVLNGGGDNTASVQLYLIP